MPCNLLQVELREVRGSLDRHLASGRASLVIHAGPGAATLRVGASEVPLLTATQTLDVHRVDSLTLRISAGAGGVDNGGNTNHNSHGNGNAAGEHSSYLLLLFANGTPAHDVARGEAVLRDLAVGRGSLGGVPQPAAAPLAPVAVAASGGRGGAAPEPLAGVEARKGGHRGCRMTGGMCHCGRVRLGCLVDPLAAQGSVVVFGECHIAGLWYGPAVCAMQATSMALVVHVQCTCLQAAPPPAPQAWH